MKAARYHEFGGPIVLEEVPVPVPGPGEVLVEVAATAHNPADSAIRAGLLKEVFALELPHTPGVEVSGVISALGSGVESPTVGDAVVAYLPATAPGAAAQYVVAPASVFAAAPTSIPLVDAAAFPATALSAYQALFEHGELQSGQRILVNGAGGAVGGYVVQLAVSAGAEVIATVSPDSAERVASYSPSHVIDHTTSTLRDGFEGEVDIVVNVAPTPTDELFDLIKAGGRLVSATTPVVSEPGRGITAVRMGTRPDAAQIEILVRAIDAGELTVWVGDRRPLEDINDVQAGRTAGKTILISTT